MNTGSLHQIFLANPFVCTDSRNVTKGALFFALKGELFDGNHFASDAIRHGAAYAVVDNPEMVVSDRYILVANALSALQDLATYHRKTFKIPIIGVTGSNGKTTTKELLTQVLSKKFVVHSTKGNYNNHIGVPLTMLAMPANTEIAVIEMGANKLGDIRQLSDIALPSYGIITNLGKAHLEGFGSFEGVIQAKTELYDAIKKCNGKLFVDADNPILKQNSNNIESILYGTCSDAEYCGKIKSEFPYLTVNYSENGTLHSLNTHLTGAYNFQNVMTTIAVGRHFGITINDICKAIADYVPSNHRSQIIITDSNVVILDAYNANPTSMQAALENLQRYPAKSKCAIVGDMFELGEYAKDEHHRILEMALSHRFDRVIAVGQTFGSFRNMFPFEFYDHVSELSTRLKDYPISDHVILLKGSRKMGLETLTRTL